MVIESRATRILSRWLFVNRAAIHVIKDPRKRLVPHSIRIQAALRAIREQRERNYAGCVYRSSRWNILVKTARTGEDVSGKSGAESQPDLVSHAPAILSICSKITGESRIFLQIRIHVGDCGLVLAAEGLKILNSNSKSMALSLRLCIERKL